MNTRLTNYAEYSNSQVAKYNSAARNKKMVLAAGAWVYATFPYVKVYPQLTIEGGFVCSTNFANLYEFKKSGSLVDNMQGPEHPYGAYLVRAGFVEAVGFNSRETVSKALRD